MKDLRKIIRTRLLEELNQDIWYHGSPNKQLNFNVQSKGNQLPYGVHFTQNNDIAHDFALGTTKLQPTHVDGYIFKCKIKTDNIFDISQKWIYTEGEEYYNILFEIGKQSRMKDFVFPTKNGTFYHPKYLGEKGYINKVDAELIMDNVKPKTIINVLKKYNINPIIKYKMVGSTDILGYNKVYTIALCVLNESFVNVLEIKTIGQVTT